MCVAGDGPTLRQGADGRPWHSHCEPRHAGATDRETSQQAAHRARKGSGSLLAKAILDELKDRGPAGATDSELQQVFEEAPPGSVSKRRCDLTREGLVADSGRIRLSRYGRAAVVWVAVDG